MDYGSPMDGMPRPGQPVNSKAITKISRAITRMNAGVYPPQQVFKDPFGSTSSQQNIDAADACATTNTAVNGTVTTIDGVTLTSGMVVLLTGQTDATQNGLWNVTASGGAWTKHVTATNENGNSGSSSSSGGSGTVTSVSGTSPISVTSGTTTPVVALTGQIAASNMPALTGDVTSSAGSVATTIAAGAVTSAKMGAGAAASNLGAAGGDLTGTYPNPTLATARALASRLINTTAPITGGGDLTADRTIAISDATATVRGAVPTPPNDTTKFFRGDATWAVPPGGVSSVSGTAPIVSSGGTTPAISINDATATVRGAVPTPPNDTTKFFRGDATWATPTSGGVTAYVQKSAAYTVLSTDGGTFFDVSTPTINVFLTLPTGVPAGFTVWLRKSDSAAHYAGFSPNAADGINGAGLGVGLVSFGQQNYGYCLTYTGVAGNGAGQGWIINYFILPSPTSGQVLKYDVVGSCPVWFGVNLAADVLGTLPAGNLPAFTGGDVTSSAGSAVLSIGAGKVTSTMFAASGFAAMMSRVCRGA